MAIANPEILLYLHGFQSSPNSLKALQTKAFFERKGSSIQFVCPQLACTPMAAWQQIEAIIEQLNPANIAVMGSSLGGFLADKVASQFKCNSVLINPAVQPYVLLSQYLGEHRHPYTQQTYHLRERHMLELRKLEVEAKDNPQQQWVLLQTGDEVLDVQLAIERYRYCKMTVECGGDHSFQGFQRYLPEIQAFLF